MNFGNHYLYYLGKFQILTSNLSRRSSQNFFQDKTKESLLNILYHDYIVEIMAPPFLTGTDSYTVNFVVGGVMRSFCLDTVTVQKLSILILFCGAVSKLCKYTLPYFSFL